MKTLTKRALSALLAMLMLIGTMGMVASATDSEAVIFTYGEDDLVIADFSKEGTREDIVYWRGDDAYAASTGDHFRDITEITDEVTLNGDTSMKMDFRYFTTTDGVADYYNSRIQRNFGLITNEENFPEEKQSKIFYTIDDVLKYDYLYMWIYSSVANDQIFNVQINDLATGMYPANIKIKMDYSGWKLHRIDISGWTVSSFDNTREGQEATATGADNIRFNLQGSGWSELEKADTVVYFDSIWLSNVTQAYKKDYDEEDYLIGDFTAVGSSAKFGGSIMRDCKEVTRDGRETSIRVSPADGTSGRLETPKSYKIGEILERDNLYMWVYSAAANNQEMFVILFDKTADSYISHTVTFDWVGWKRVKIGKDDWNKKYELASFNKGEAVATNADDAYMWLSATWNKIPYLEDTKLYFDSIWFSDKDLKDGETFAAPANEWETDGGYLLADFFSENANVKSWGAATSGYYHSDKMTDEIVRFGKNKSLKWPAPALGGDARLKSPNIPIATFSSYKYIYAWIYSTKANGQLLSYVLNYNGTNLICNVEMVMDYEGWKLCRIDMSSFWEKLTIVEEKPNCYMWLQQSGYHATQMNDTLLYVDSIWLSNADYYANEGISIKDFNNADATFTGTFNTISGSRKAKKVNSVNTYGNSAYSAEIIPHEDNYTFATDQLYYNGTGMDISSMNLKEKYLNIIINPQNAENQQIRINFDGKMADGTTTMRVYKILNGLESGWQILSLPLAEFRNQNGAGNTIATLEGAGLLNSVDLHIPDWGNGRETGVKVGDVLYRLANAGETAQYIYDKEAGTMTEGTPDEGATYVKATYVNGNYYWDNIANKVSSDAKYYIDSIFLSDKDMSKDITLKCENTITEDVQLDGFKAVFKAPYSLCLDNELYKKYVTVTKNGEAVSQDEYKTLVDNNRLIVEFVNSLDFNSTYEIKAAKGLVMDNKVATTEDCVLTISTLRKYASFVHPINVTESGKVTFTAAATKDNASATVSEAPEGFVSLSARTELKNDTNADMNVCMIIAVYDSNDQLAGMFKGGDVKIAAGGEGAVTTTVIGAYENCTAKAFLWDMTTGAMVPYLAATPLN